MKRSSPMKPRIDPTMTKVLERTIEIQSGMVPRMTIRNSAVVWKTKSTTQKAVPAKRFLLCHHNRTISHKQMMVVII